MFEFSIDRVIVANGIMQIQAWGCSGCPVNDSLVIAVGMDCAWVA